MDCHLQCQLKEVRELKPLTSQIGMNSIVRISNRNVIGAQKTTWVATAINIALLVPFIIKDFNMNALLVTVATLALHAFFHYRSFNFWNVWFEDGNIYVENLYRRRSMSIERFVKVETMVFRNVYGLYVDSGEVYQFRLSQTEDLKLFLKVDERYYAKALTKALLELKKNASNPMPDDQ